MMFPEQKAQNYLCPAGHQRYCSGSTCMAWRWFDNVSDDGTGCFLTPTALVARHPDNDPHIPRPLDERRGYCGLAGKP